jgi:hypothetical protein
LSHSDDEHNTVFTSPTPGVRSASGTPITDEEYDQTLQLIVQQEHEIYQPIAVMERCSVVRRRADPMFTDCSSKVVDPDDNNAEATINVVLVFDVSHFKSPYNFEELRSGDRDKPPLAYHLTQFTNNQVCVY